MRRSKRCGYWQ